jgi:mRNA interferase HigB
MNINLIKKKTISNYYSNNSNSKVPLMVWLYAISVANWYTPNDICLTFKSADLLGNGTNRVVFNIGGNKYRMICSYYFGENRVHLYINWIGTHSEYDKICKNNQQYTIKIY